MNQWESNANYVARVYGSFVDWDERFYLCPECGEPVYECDWDENTLCDEYCPICGFMEEDAEEDEEF